MPVCLHPTHQNFQQPLSSDPVNSFAQTSGPLYSCPCPQALVLTEKSRGTVLQGSVKAPLRERFLAKSFEQAQEVTWLRDCIAVMVSLSNHEPAKLFLANSRSDRKAHPIMFVEVAINIPSDRTFTYAVPAVLRGDVSLGKRVLVPFGKRSLTGTIVGIRRSTDRQDTRGDHPGPGPGAPLS